MFSCKAPYTENSPFLLLSCYYPAIEVPGNHRKENENRSSIDVMFLFHYCILTYKAVLLSQSQSGRAQSFSILQRISQLYTFFSLSLISNHLFVQFIQTIKFNLSHQLISQDQQLRGEGCRYPLYLQLLSISYATF